MTFARIELAIITLLLAGVSAPVTAQEPTPAAPQVLTNAAQVRQLTAPKAAKALPVRLTGVMLGVMLQEPQSLTLMDDTGGIFVTARNNDRNLFAKYRRGDLLEITGVTSAGGFAPIVQAHNVRKQGVAPIPPPLPVTHQQLMTGALDGQWVEIQGVVRQSFAPWTNSAIWRIVVAVGSGRVPVRFSASSHPGGIAVDSEVRVRALCLSQFNPKRQFISPVLQVPEGEPVLVTRTALADPYTAPFRDAAELRSFAPENLRAHAHRVHVRGVVLSHQVGAFVWLRDGTTGLRLQTSQEALDLHPGDEIDALGFPALGVYPATLEDSVFRKIGMVPPPGPVALTNLSQAFNHPNDLIALDALLARIQTTPDGIILTFDKDKQSFEAILKKTSGLPPPTEWQPGSYVRVAGICSSVYDDPRPFAGVWQPKTFQLLLRSPADLVVLIAPPWWTPQRIIYALGIICAGLLIASGIGVTLSRRRLKEQAHRREMAEAEFAAILTERNRVAREIHDTLAQGLAATSVQLRLARKQAGGDPEALHHHLDSAQQLVRDSLEEARSSIWNTRSQVLETGDLPTALKGILQQMADGTDLRTALEVTGRPRRFAPIIENNLLRVGQEAITNAARHARAKNLKVTLDFSERQFRLTVCDDGHGFDPAQPPQSPGGFGLMGMRERAKELKGDWQVRSKPEAGTEIILTVPLAGNGHER